MCWNEIGSNKLPRAPGPKQMYLDKTPIFLNYGGFAIYLVHAMWLNPSRRFDRRFLKIFRDSCLSSLQRVAVGWDIWKAEAK